MNTVSISALKANLSRYLRYVRRGGEGPATSILDNLPVKLSTSISQALAKDRIDRL